MWPWLLELSLVQRSRYRRLDGARRPWLTLDLDRDRSEGAVVHDELVWTGAAGPLFHPTDETLCVDPIRRGAGPAEQGEGHLGPKTCGVPEGVRVFVRAAVSHPERR